MAISVKVGTFSKKNDGTGEQDVVDTSFTPVALILWTEGATAADTYRTSIRNSVGLCASNAQYAVGFAQNDAVSTGQGSKRYASAALTIVDGVEALQAEAELVSFNADGFTLDWTTNDANAYLIHYLAIGGAAVEAAVLDWAIPTTLQDLAVTGAGFRPTSYIHIYPGPVTSVNSTTTLGSMGMGFVGSNGEMAAIYSVVNEGAGIGKRTTLLSDASIVQDNPTTTIVEGLHTSFDADGFSTRFIAASGTAGRVATLCLRGVHSTVAAETKPTGAAPATDANTAAGFTPVGALFFSHNDTAESETGSVARSFGATDGTNQAVGFHNAQGSDMDAISMTDRVMVVATNTTQTIEAEAAFTSFDASGLTVTWNPNDAVAVRWGYMAFAEVADADLRLAHLAVEVLLKYTADLRLAQFPVEYLWAVPRGFVVPPGQSGKPSVGKGSGSNKPKNRPIVGNMSAVRKVRIGPE